MIDINKMTTHEIAQYLRHERKTAFILWQVEDVYEMANQMEVDISTEEAVKIIRSIDKYACAENGISWYDIEFHIEEFVRITRND
jgi:hypothetical protein